MELVPVPAVIPAQFVTAPQGGGDSWPLRRTLGVVTLAWMFGSVWSTITTSAPLTLFAKGLGASNFEFGLLTALPFIASLASLPGSLLAEGTGGRKTVFLSSLYLQRALWFPIALLPMWMVGRSGVSPGALWAFLLLAFVMFAAGSAGGPVWVSWMAELVPGRINGKYFSRRRQFSILTAVPAAVFVGYFLDRPVAGALDVLRWCSILFMCAAVFGLADIHLFRYVPAVSKPRQSGRALLRALRQPLRDRSFMKVSLFVAALTFAVNFLGQFATLYLIEQVHVTNLGVQMILVVAPMVGQLLVLGMWGRAADRMGKKPLLHIASVGLVPIGIGWCFLGPHDVWLGYVLTGLGAALWTGVEVANLNLTLETSGRARVGGSSYCAVNSVMINLAGCFGGLAAGLIGQTLRDWHWQPMPWLKTFSFYDVLFVASGVLRLASVLVFLPLIHERNAQSAGQALRFMMNHLCRRRAHIENEARPDPVLPTVVLHRGGASSFTSDDVPQRRCA